MRNPHKSTLLKIVYSPPTPRPASVERRVTWRGEEFRKINRAKLESRALRREIVGEKLASQRPLSKWKL